MDAKGKKKTKNKKKDKVVIVVFTATKRRRDRFGASSPSFCRLFLSFLPHGDTSETSRPGPARRDPARPGPARTPRSRPHPAAPGTGGSPAARGLRAAAPKFCGVFVPSASSFGFGRGAGFVCGSSFFSPLPSPPAPGSPRSAAVSPARFGLVADAGSALASPATRGAKSESLLPFVRFSVRCPRPLLQMLSSFVSFFRLSSVRASKTTPRLYFLYILDNYRYIYY